MTPTGKDAHTMKAYKSKPVVIVKELAGSILAALIFTAAVLTSAFGMTGEFDHLEPIALAEVGDAR